jgi:hypothetical protein
MAEISLNVVGNKYSSISSAQWSMDKSGKDAIAWYKFDDNYDDSSGNGFALTPINNPQFVNTANNFKVGSHAIYFDNSVAPNKYIEISNKLNPYDIWYGNGLTFTLWFKLSNTTTARATGSSDGLTFNIYKGGYFADDVNWFNGRTPNNTGTVTNFTSLSTTTNGLKADGATDVYSIQWFGFFYATLSGSWTFYTVSDDASYLWFGDTAISGYTTGNALVNNGGRHGMQERSGTINLVANTYYPIRIQQGNGGGPSGMTVSFTPPGGFRIYNGTGYYYTNQVVLFDIADGTIDGVSNNSILIAKNDLNNALIFSVKTTTIDIKYITEASYIDNIWHHIVWSISVSGEWYIYIDNQKLAVNIVCNIPNVSWTKRYIGRSGNYAALYTTGYFDDFRIYKGVLSSNEIAILYNNGNGINTPVENVNITYNKVKLYSNEIQVPRNMYYVNYMFENSQKLLTDNSGNNRSLTTLGNYELTDGKNSLLLTNKDATLPSTNWSTFNDLSISGWFKTSELSNSEKLLEFVYDEQIDPAFVNDTSSLIVWYKFNQDTTNMLLDTSGNNNNSLTNVNCTFNSTDFKTFNGSIAFTGSSYLQVTNDGRFSPDNFTISCWCKIVPPAANTYATIASCRNSTTVISGWIIYIYNNNLEFWTGNGSASSAGTWSGAGINLFSSFATNPTVWRHLVISMNKTTSTAVIYINGALITTVSRSYVNNTATNLRIGAGANETSPALYLPNGSLLDDFRIYNRVLTANEISMLYATTNTLYNPGYNISLKRRNQFLSFQVNDTPVYETSNLLDNTWNHVVWNIVDSTSSLGYVQINNGPKNVYNQMLLSQPIFSQFPPSAMTAMNTTINGITYRACAYDYYDDIYPPHLAFTKNASSANAWIGQPSNYTPTTGVMKMIGYSFGNDTSFKGGYLGIDMGQKIVMKSYKVTRVNATWAERLPKTWKIYATNDDRCWNATGGKYNKTAAFNTGPDVGWVEIDYELNQTTYTDDTLFNLPNNYAGYRYYAINVNSLRGGAATSDVVLIGEWYIFGYPYYTYMNRLGAPTNQGNLYLSDLRLHTAAPTTEFENNIYDKFTLQAQNNAYIFPRNPKVISLSKEELELNRLDYNTSDNFSISTWFKTENFVNNDTILEITNSFLTDTTNLYFWYKFDSDQFLKNFGIAGSTYDLMASTGNSLTYQSSDKVYGDASINFTSTNGYLLTPSYNFATYFNNAITISFWLKRKGLNTSGDVIIYNGANTQIQRNSTNNYWSFNLFGNIGNTNGFLNDFTADNTWNHYVWMAERIGTQTKITVFKNGSQVYTNTAGTWTPPNNNFTISSDITTNTLIGNLDDFRIYNKVLTNNEINALYNLQNTNNILIKRDNNQLSFLINNVSVYNTPFIDNTWNYVLWNIASNNDSKGFVQINNGSKRYFDKIAINTNVLNSTNEFPPISIAGGQGSVSSGATSTLASRLLSGTFADGTYTASASSVADNSPDYAFNKLPTSDSDTTTNDRWASAATYNSSTGAYSGAVSTSYYATKTATSTSTYSGEWLQLQMPSSIVIASYSISTERTILNRGPKNMIVLGSNDGTNWYLLDTETNITGYSGNVAKPFTVSSNTTLYSYYRLCIGANNNNTNTAVGEWKLFGYQNMFLTKLGSRANEGDLHLYNYQVVSAQITSQLESELYAAVSPSDTAEHLKYANIQMYEDKIKIQNKDYSSNLTLYTQSNDLNIIGSGTIVKDYNKTCLFLKNGQEAVLPNNNWMNYGDLTVSGWFKSDIAQSGDDIILEMTTGNVPKNNFFKNTTNLYFWYKFDSIDFCKNYGLTGKDYDLVPSSSSSTIYPQKTDKVYGDASANFTASAGYLSTPSYNFATNFSSAFTISFWLKRNNVNTSWDVIFYGWLNSAINAALIIQRNGNFTYWDIRLFGNNSNTSGLLNDYTADKVWNHYVWIAEKVGTSTRISAYKNGVFVYTNTAGTWTPPNMGFILSTTSTAQTLIGNLDDLRIYNKVLSQDEINTLYYNNGFYTQTANLLTWYQFNGDSKSMLNDSSGNNNMLIPNSTTNILYDGVNKKYGTSSLSINDTTAFLSNTAINLASKSFTIAFWLRLSGLTSTTDGGYIISQGNAGGTRTSIHIGWLGTQMQFSFFGDDFYSPTYNYSAMNNNWVHWGFTYNVSNNQRIIYKDGVQVASGTSVGAPVPATGTWRIGLSAVATTWISFRGNLDDVRVYDRVITASEAYTLYSINNDMPNNYIVRRIDNTLSFQINNMPIYEAPYTNDTWNQFIWNISNSSTHQGFVKLNNGSRNYFNEVLPSIPGIFKYPPAALTANRTVLSGYGVNSGTYICDASTAATATEQPFRVFNWDNVTAANTNWWASAQIYTNNGSGAYLGSISTTVSGISYSGEWLQIQMPTSIVLKYYYLYVTSTTTQSWPKNFVLAGSNDGVSWALLDYETNTSPVINNSRLFTLPNNTQVFSYYRIIVLTIGTEFFARLLEWELYGYPNYSYTNKLGSVNNQGTLYLSDFNVFTTRITPALENRLYTQPQQYKTLGTDEYLMNTMKNLNALYHNGSKKIEANVNGASVYGTVTASGSISSFYSDMRLKDVVSAIDHPLEKIRNINAFKYIPSDLAKSLNFLQDTESVHVGVNAQDVQRVLPEVVELAPFDSSNLATGEIISKSGENYLSLSYESMIPLLIECTKELKTKFDSVKQRKQPN